MTDQNMKHPNYSDELLPVNNDLFRPEFKRDTRGRYFMQLPGYGKWMVSVEPGSKIITQGSEDEAGGPATDPGSIQTGSINVETVISVGDNIFLDGGTGCIHVGDYLNRIRASMSICGGGMRGYSGQDTVFGFYLEDSGIEWRSGENLDVGDVFIGGLGSDEFILWNDSEGKLYIKGDLIIEGDIQSANYVYNTSGYKLEYLTGNAYFNAVYIHGGTIDESLITNLLPGSEPSIQGWSHDMDFTAVDYNTIQWTGPGGAATGTIYLMDGTTYTVNSGSMDMTNDDPFYIYYNGSSTLSTSGNPSDAVGSGKILMCVCKRNADTGKLAVFQVFGNEGQGVFITADDIAANTITANEIFANTITANEIATNTITANQIASLYFTGKYAEFDLGNIGGWVISSQCLTKDKDIGVAGESRIQLCIGPGTSAGHLQAAYNHNRLSYPGFPHPNAPIDLIQMTQGDASDPSGQPEPRLDIYRATASNQSKKRMELNAFGLHFFDENENLVGTITGKDAGTQTNFDINDISIANNTVRILSTGVRVAYTKAFSAADNAGRYFQMYCDSTVYGIAGVLSAPTSNYIKIQNDGGGAIAYFNGVPGGQWALSLFGNLGLYTNTYDQGSTIGAMYYNTSTGTLRLRTGSGWTDVGGSGLPSGNAYDMLRCSSGTSWITTSVLYLGARSDYRIYRDWSGDAYFEVPSGYDYAFKRGSTFYAIIDNNFWTSGNLYADGQLSTGGTIQNSAGDIICNNGNLQLRKTGAIVAVRDSGGTTRYLTCKLDAVVGKYILST